MPRSEGMWLPPGMKYRQIYLCLWEMPDGRYVGTRDGEFLCAESYTINDKGIERKMREVALTDGYEGGKPTWMPGRKVSAMEADDQMERLLDGKVPDEREETLFALEDEHLRQQYGP